jgi:hypothetical protein
MTHCSLFPVYKDAWRCTPDESYLEESNSAHLQRPAGYGTERSTSTEHRKRFADPTSESMHCDSPVEMCPCVMVPLRISCCPDASVSPWWWPAEVSPSWSSLSAQRACPHALFTWNQDEDARQWGTRITITLQLSIMSTGTREGFLAATET